MALNRKTKQKPNRIPNIGSITEVEVEDEVEREAINEFLKYRVEIRKPFKSVTAVKKMINSLRKLAGGNKKKMKAIVDRTIANGWQGLFALPEDKDNDRPNYQELD